MSKLNAILKWLQIVGDDDNLSLTNLAVWIALWKLATAANVIGPMDVGTLIGALASYQAKRWIKHSSSAAAAVE